MFEIFKNLQMLKFTNIQNFQKFTHSEFSNI